MAALLRRLYFSSTGCAWSVGYVQLGQNTVVGSMTELMTPLYYLSGSVNMVAAIIKVHEDHMKTEAFSGYSI
jgi:hypothetical protein